MAKLPKTVEGAVSVSDYSKSRDQGYGDADEAFKRSARSKQAIKDAEEDARQGLRERKYASNPERVKLKHKGFIEYDSNNPGHAGAYHEFSVHDMKEHQRPYWKTGKV